MQLKRNWIIGLILLMVVLVAASYFLLPAEKLYKIPPANNRNTATRAEALALINQCQAAGTYSLHNGEVGLTLKDDSMKPVQGVTEQYLQENQNPACPFTKATME